jgi:hypothetical protein
MTKPQVSVDSQERRDFAAWDWCIQEYPRLARAARNAQALALMREALANPRGWITIRMRYTR